MSEASQLFERESSRSYRQIQGLPWQCQSFDIASWPTELHVKHRGGDPVAPVTVPNLMHSKWSSSPVTSCFGAGLLGTSVELMQAAARQMQN